MPKDHAKADDAKAVDVDKGGKAAGKSDDAADKQAVLLSKSVRDRPDHQHADGGGKASHKAESRGPGSRRRTVHGTNGRFCGINGRSLPGDS